MSKINILSLTKTFNANKIKTSSSLTVRDLDEEAPGSFVAYVDDKDESYDVSIKLSPEKDVLDISCDCTENGICSHKLALMLHLSKANAPKKTPKKKKTSKYDEILEGIEIGALKNWVLGLLKQKDIELLFMSEFGNTQKEFTAEEVDAIIKNSIKVVVGNRKNIAASEVKKIADMLEVGLKPVLAFCFSDLSINSNYLLFKRIIVTIREYDMSIYSNSVKLSNFIDKLVENAVSDIASSSDFEKTKRIIDFTIQNTYATKSMYIESFDWIILRRLYSEISTDALTEKYFRDKIKETFVAAIKREHKYDVGIFSQMLNLFVEKGGFEETFQYFKPLKHEHNYNLKLIDALIQINQLALAVEYAKKKITDNVNSSYNFEYWNKLLIVYRIQKDDVKTATALKETLLYSYNYDDYKWLETKLSAEDFKNYKRKLLNRASSGFREAKAEYFFFKVSLEEKNIKQLFEKMKNAKYSTIYDFREELYAADKKLLLYELRQSSRYYYSYGEIEREKKKLLLQWLPTKYSPAELGNIEFWNKLFGGY